MDSTAQEAIIEQIIELLKNANGRLSLAEPVKIGIFKGEPYAYVATIRRMANKGLVLPDGDSTYVLTDYGWIFKGFKQEQKELEAKNKSEEDLRQSIISANVSSEVNTINQAGFMTRQINIMTRQHKLIKFSTLSTILLSLISVGLLGLTAFLQYHDKTALEVKALRKEVQKSSQQLQSISASQQRIDSSIRQIADSLK